MTLRKRTLLIIGAMFLGLILILFFITQGILLGSHENMPGDIYEQLRSITAYLMFSIVGFGLIFGVATIFLLEKQVISRLSRLSKSVGGIGKSGDLSARVSVKGTDELADVAGTINGMLAALQQSRTELQGLYKEEKDLRQELQAEINKRVEFTRALVHEIKTPLTPVVMASELLLEELKEEPALGLVRSINNGAYNLNQRIDELLDLARGEVGMLNLSSGSVDPLQLLRDMAHYTMPIAKRNGQSLNLELPSSLPLIYADEDRLRQVVLNLLNNAFKFTSSGGEITLRAKKEDGNLVIEVQDNGHGISKEDQRRVFEPYHQLGGETARRRGLGLGLSLARTLVELHGGRMWVKSQKGKGSTFGFSIPFETTNLNKKVKTNLK
ncbi:ATP-binding protein [Chloroflexota bacterium]